MRKHLRERNERGDYITKQYLSWFSLSKIVELAPRISSKTFEYITKVPENYDKYSEDLHVVMSEMKTHAQQLWRRYVPHISKIPLHKGISWDPTWKGTPILDSYLANFYTVPKFIRTKGKYGRFVGIASDHDELSRYDKDKYTASFIPPNIFSNLKHELAAYAWNVNKIHSIQDGFFSPGILWYPRTLFALDIRNTTTFSNIDLDFYERSAGPQLSSLMDAYSRVPLVTGRLCQTLSGGGKRRIFAICNYVKQCLLSPVHDWSFKVFSSIPMDGTFDQEGPLRRLRAKGVNSNIFSFDLKSATDRWPLSIIYTMFSTLFGQTFASSVVNSSLGLNEFLLTKQFVRKPRSVSFLVGQPLGYKGSWSLFSLSHHFIVWCAAAKAYPESTTPFTDYALLGDDIVIADQCVALEYRRYLALMGVSISLPKSIISTNGSCEFGKRFWTDFLKKDLSPISMKALLDCRNIRGLAQLRHKYNIERLFLLCRLGGGGYRVCSRLMSKQTPKWERLKVVSSKPFGRKQMPLEFWIGRGKLPTALASKISVCFRQIPLYLNEKELFCRGRSPKTTQPYPLAKPRR